ncbi:hypothetical protein HZR84_13895 [Hyphobacterium sp. CCMP332]|nr:hypothetical protein HZR84_13895 [Hyphobacterium sp. CCMP332]
MDEPMPKGEEGIEAEKLADRMLMALNKRAWDSVKVVSWSYPPGHHYTWFKKLDSVIVNWENITVYLNTKAKKGRVQSKTTISSKDTSEIIQTAYEYFINDSFWLGAPFKVRDSGTKRKVVNYEGNKALLVTYTSGGVTPGDTYLWILDDNYRPKSWKFWVSIIPVGGVEFTWDDWKSINGALISTSHKGPLNLKIEVSDLKGS